MVDKEFVAIRKVSKIYPNSRLPAVDNIDLSIRQGSFFGLLGPNGAGKTTLLSMICGLLAPTSGSISIGPDSAKNRLSQYNGLLGLVPQELALYPTLTAGENLAFFGAMQGLSGASLKNRIKICLEITKLEARINDKVENFSGGLKRRLNLAVGLLHEPKLLVLDEPTVGIDPQSRNFIFDSLRQLNNEGITLIYTTHYMEEAEQLCDDIAIIDSGKIIARGALDELLHGNQCQSILFRTNDPLPSALIEKISALPLIEKITSANSKTEILIGNDPSNNNILTDVLESIKNAGLDITSLTMGATNLEQLFLQLTGTQLRD